MKFSLLSICAVVTVLLVMPTLAKTTAGSESEITVEWLAAMTAGCYITCGGQTVDCSCSPTSCSATSSTLVCNGHTTTCSEVSAWSTCQDDCDDDWDSCLWGCGGKGNFPCVHACQQALVSCILGCGSNPASNTCG